MNSKNQNYALHNTISSISMILEASKNANNINVTPATTISFILNERLPSIMCASFGKINIIFMFCDVHAVSALVRYHLIVGLVHIFGPCSIPSRLRFSRKNMILRWISTPKLANYNICHLKTIVLFQTTKMVYDTTTIHVLVWFWRHLNMANMEMSRLQQPSTLKLYFLIK